MNRLSLPHTIYADTKRVPIFYKEFSHTGEKSYFSTLSAHSRKPNKLQEILLRAYDANLPLVVIHIPKTAGASVREIYKGWFADGLLLHYFRERTGEMPTKHDIAVLHTHKRPVAVYGHFNSKRAFGIEDYYPQAEQFITILRDPFERAISAYFFLRKQGKHWKDQSKIPEDDLRTHILNIKGSMLVHFPCEVTLDNYKEIIETRFIEIGVTEHLDESMLRIAKKLNKTYLPGSLNRLNATEKDQLVPYDLKQEFMQSRPLDYAVYNYARAKYEAGGESH